MPVPRGDSPPWPRRSHRSCWCCPATARSDSWWSTPSCCASRSSTLPSPPLPRRSRSSVRCPACCRSVPKERCHGQYANPIGRTLRVSTRGPAHAVTEGRRPPRSCANPVTGPGDHQHHDPPLSRRRRFESATSRCAWKGRSGSPHGNAHAPAVGAPRAPSVQEPRRSRAADQPRSHPRGRVAVGAGPPARAPSSISSASTRPTTSSSGSTGRRPTHTGRIIVRTCSRRAQPNGAVAPRQRARDGGPGRGSPTSRAHDGRRHDDDGGRRPATR